LHRADHDATEQYSRSGTRALDGRMTTMKLQYSHITVNDVDESVAFYRDGLGLEVRNDVSSGPFRWVTLGGDDGTEVVLSQPHAGRSEADGDALQQLLTKGVLPVIVFSSPDLDAAFEQARATGAEVLQEPIEQPWGPRDCAFRDPSGNIVRINDAR
jgi:predicted enzyme related to lactoylglutathione lyase